MTGEMEGREGIKIMTKCYSSLLLLAVCFMICLGGCDKPKAVKVFKKPNIGTGVTGGPSPEADIGVFINPNGLVVAQAITTDKCPLVYVVTANASMTTPVCNPTFNYSKLVTTTSGKVGSYIRNYTCPEFCPFKEFYPNVNSARRYSRECIGGPNGPLQYWVSYSGYFVCTNHQI